MNIAVMTAALLLVLAVYVKFAPAMAYLAWDAPASTPR